MSVLITASYEGQLRCRATHQPSGATLITDAPVDNQGQGASFSPTDLAATGAITCMMTILAIQARSLGLGLEGMHGSVEKVMSSTPPRCIAGLTYHLHIPGVSDEMQRRRLESAARSCPVLLSLHPDIVEDLAVHWD